MSVAVEQPELLSSNIIDEVRNYVDSIATSTLWTGENPMWPSKESFFLFKLEQWRQRLVQDAMYDILNSNGNIKELKVMLAKATEILVYLESQGRDKSKARIKMDEVFGMFLMRSPEVKRWD